MKKLIAVILITLATVIIAVPTQALHEAPPAVNRQCAKVEKKIHKKYKRSKIYTWNVQTDEEVWDLITHRKGLKYNVVLCVYGQCIDNKGNGIDNMGYYISYRGVKGAKKGKWIFTYLVYRRGNNHEDDIIARYDVVMK